MSDSEKIEKLQNTLSELTETLKLYTTILDQILSRIEKIEGNGSSTTEEIDLEEKPKETSNKGKKWTSEDDKKMLEMHNSGKTAKEIAEVFGRTEYAITLRLKKNLNEGNKLVYEDKKVNNPEKVAVEMEFAEEL